MEIRHSLDLQWQNRIFLVFSDLSLSIHAKFCASKHGCGEVGHGFHGISRKPMFSGQNLGTWNAKHEKPDFVLRPYFFQKATPWGPHFTTFLEIQQNVR
jgi:hypothetical protein